MKSPVALTTLALLLFGCGDSADPASSGPEGSSGAATGATDDGPAATDSGATSDATTAAEGDSTAAAEESSSGDAPPSGSPGCGGDPSAIPATLTIEGVERDFFYVLPDNYDPEQAYPLVFAWHARGTSGPLAQVYYLVEESSNGQAIFVYPDGLPIASQGGQTGWNLEEDGYDMVFFDELYAQLTGNLCVDLDRVFSTGHSFGGFMSNSVGCYRGDLFRAIAPVASGGPYTACDGPMAAWIAHGTADQTVPFSSGVASYDYWRAQNGCGDDGVATDPPQCVIHEDCDAGYPIVWCQHDEAQPLNGHGWPTWAGPAIWDFFATF